MIYSLGWDDLLTALVVSGIIVVFAATFRNYLNQRVRIRKEVAKNIRLQSRDGSTLKDVLHGGAKSDVAIESLPATDKDGTDFFAKRNQRKDQRFDREIQRRAQTRSRDSKKSDELDVWFNAEERRRASLKNAAEQELAESMQVPENLAADPAVRQWAESSDTQLLSASGGLDGTAHSEIYAKIQEIGESVAREAGELDYVIDKLETSIEFISMEFRETVENWKIGKAHRSDSLEDIKRRFRVKTFSLDDAWGMVFSYPDWVSRNRRKLKKLIAQLGVADLRDSEKLTEMLARAEQGEWTKSLDIDMDLIFILREVAKSGKLLDSMAERLKHLEAVCSRRSGQIIAPNWEGRSLQG